MHCWWQLKAYIREKDEENALYLRQQASHCARHQPLIAVLSPPGVCPSPHGLRQPFTQVRQPITQVAAINILHTWCYLTMTTERQLASGRVHHALPGCSLLTNDPRANNLKPGSIPCLARHLHDVLPADGRQATLHAISRLSPPCEVGGETLHRKDQPQQSQSTKSQSGCVMHSPH